MELGLALVFRHLSRKTVYCSADVRNYILPMNTGDFTHTLHNMTFFQNTLRIHGRIL